DSLTSNCFAKGSHVPETFASIKAIATGRDGTVWVARETLGKFLQLEHFEQEHWTTISYHEIAINNSDVTTLFVDRENTIWVGTANHGVLRIVGNEVRRFGRTDGLSSDAVGRFYQDVEGTVWVVTSAGLDNFRDLKVVTYTMREGLTAAGAGTVLAA